MKRTTLRRSTQLRRRSRIRQRRTEPRRGPARDESYKREVRALDCAARDMPGHRGSGPCDPHHAGYKGQGQQCSDYETIPLHRQCHDDWHDGRGPFEGMDKLERREWSAKKIAETQAEVVRRRGALDAAKF